MCGIAGILSRRISWQPNSLLASRLIAALRHRGPDGDGHWADDHALLVHTRLAILDPQAGQQPLANEDGSILVTFNGEIYNSPELRQQLQARGHIFRTRTDTEVLVHLYEEHGLEMVRFLKGMFAFAIWDTNKKSLLLARDRFGIKPLYYTFNSSHVVFASQPNVIFASALYTPRIDPLSIPIFLYYGHTPIWRCVYAGVKKLPPGHVLTIDVRSWRMETRAYWRFPFPEQVTVRKNAITSELRERIARVVTASLLSDVPLGIALSGGLDSSIVAYHVTTNRGIRPATFTIRWDDIEPQDSEWRYADLVAGQLRLQAHSFYMPNDLRTLLLSLYHSLDEPLGDTSILPLYHLCLRAREHVKVLLSGDGGDELFGGYKRYMLNSQELAIGQVLPSEVICLLLRGAELLPWSRSSLTLRKLSRLLSRLTVQPGLAYAVSLGQTPLPLIASWLERDLVSVLMKDIASVAALWDEFPLRHHLHKMVCCDLHVLLPECFLTKSDRASMAVGLEIRPCLLDEDLLEWSLSLPVALHLGHWETKKLLRSAYRDVLPPPVVRNAKHGFHLRGLHTLVSQCLADLISKLHQSSELHYFLNVQAILKSIEVFKEGNSEYAHGLWNLYSYLLWYTAWHPCTP